MDLPGGLGASRHSGETARIRKSRAEMRTKAPASGPARVASATFGGLAPGPDVTRIRSQPSARAATAASNPESKESPVAEVQDITDQEFQSEVLDASTPVIVDFWAEWCAPCRQIAPIVKELAGEYEGKVRIVKMNVDESPQTPGKYGVRAIPTVLAFQNGQVVEQLQGARPKAAFEEMISKLL